MTHRLDFSSLPVVWYVYHTTTMMDLQIRNLNSIPRPTQMAQTYLINISIALFRLHFLISHSFFIYILLCLSLSLQKPHCCSYRFTPQNSLENSS